MVGFLHRYNAPLESGTNTVILFESKRDMSNTVSVHLVGNCRDFDFLFVSLHECVVGWGWAERENDTILPLPSFSLKAENSREVLMSECFVTQRSWK